MDSFEAKDALIKWIVIRSLQENCPVSQQDLKRAIEIDPRIYNLIKDPSEEITKLYRLLTL